MKQVNGLSQDTRPHEQPDGTYPFGKNGIQHDTKGVTTNELGFNVDSATVPGEVCGVIETDGPAIIFSSHVDGTSKIGLYDKDANAYSMILDDSAFPTGDKWNFNRDHYITGEFQRNFKNERIVAWTDKNTHPRVLNIDDTSSVAAAKDTLLFLQANTPTLSVNVDTGGILEKGAYFVAVRLLKNDGSETGYLTIAQPAIISDPNVGTITDKALTINVSNIDQSYDKVQLAIVSRINGIYKAIALDAREITPGTMTVIYTGENLAEPIGLDEIIVPNAVYSKVGTMGQLNDALYIADLEKEPELDLQQYANMIKVRVKSELIDVIPQTPDHVSGKKRSLMHQEVYALYIRFHKTSGGWTRGFHIPGNAPLVGDMATATSPHEIDLGARIFHTRDTNRNVNVPDKSCDTGIWVNMNETYPNLPQFDSSAVGGLDLRGQQVRHHRMPSLAFCKEQFYPGTGGANGDYGRTKLDILGLEVSNVIVPADLQPLIDGYEILIAKRTLANSLVLGQSLLLVAAQANRLRGTNTGYLSTGGNFHAGTVTGRNNDNGANNAHPNSLTVVGRNWAQATSGVSAATGEKTLRFRLHPFDVLFNKPAITPAYLSAQYKLHRNDLQIAYPNGGALEDGEMDDQGMPVMHLIDYTKSVAPVLTTVNQRVRVVEDTKYLPNHVNTGEYQNLHLESAFVGKIKWIGSDGDAPNNDLPLGIAYSTINEDNFQRTFQKLRFEETYLVNLMDHKQDIYDTFYAQPLVASGQFIPTGPTVSPTIYVGDSFLNDYTYHTYGWFNADDFMIDDQTEVDLYSGYKIIRRVICEAVSNINLRYEIPGNIYSKWWPKHTVTADPTTTAGTYLYDFDRRIDPNQFGYSKDLNTVNDFGNYSPFNPYFDDITKFPFRVHRGGKLPRQGKLRSWRTFLPLDYYETQKNMGKIMRVLGKSDKLLIHHENALFLTQDKAKLEAGPLSVTLGQGDIFQFEPQEAMASRQGYAGTQHELAAVDTPWGYIFPDAKQGQIFMYRDGVKLMNQGLNQFFRQYLRLSETNPFIGNGITIGYDPQYKRILLTVKNKVVSTGIEDFVPDYEETEEFFSGLTPGISIVKAKGRLLLFLGENSSEYECSTNEPPEGSDAEIVIEENTPNNTLVFNMGQVFSDDGPLSFAIMGGNVGGAFTINPATGDIYVANSIAIDYEQIQTFSLVIRAIDTHGAFVDAVLTVHVIEVNEPPRLNDYEFTIPESASIGTNVGQVIAVDPEAGTLAYSFPVAVPGFAINSSTGMITTTAALDYETQQAYQFQVLVTSSTTLTATCLVTIYVLNVNESPLGTDATVSVYKDTSLPNELVHTMVVTDPDADPITVTWTNSALLGPKFTFNPTTLEVHLVNPALVNPGEQYILTFSVDDGNGNTDTFSLTVNITISELNFEAGDHTCIGASCDPGYTLAPDNSYCYQYSDTAATPPSGGTPFSTEARQLSVYSEFGSVIYSPGFLTNGTGPYTKINLANAWWRNIPNNTTDGPLNRCGLWAVQPTIDPDPDDNPTGVPIGFTVPISIPTSKTYYIGLGGDNRCQIKVNGVTVVDQDPASIATNHDIVEGTGPYGVDTSFKFWHIYPVDLVAGPSIIEVTGINDGSPGAFGCEIYDNTSAEIQAATSYSGLTLIFSTKDVRGQTLQLGGTVAWTCPSGYSLVETSPGVFTCRQILTDAINEGFTKHWTTVLVKDGDDNLLATLLNAPGQTYMGQAVPYYPDEADSVDCGYLAP